MNNENNNIKDLIDMCKTTVGDVTLCKELPESTLEVVNEMIREVFYGNVVFSNVKTTQSF